MQSLASPCGSSHGHGGREAPLVALKSVERLAQRDAAGQQGVDDGRVGEHGGDDHADGVENLLLANDGASGGKADLVADLAVLMVAGVGAQREAIVDAEQVDGGVALGLRAGGQVAGHAAPRRDGRLQQHDRALVIHIHDDRNAVEHGDEMVLDDLIAPALAVEERGDGGERQRGRIVSHGGPPWARRGPSTLLAMYDGSGADTGSAWRVTPAGSVGWTG